MLFDILFKESLPKKKKKERRNHCQIQCCEAFILCFTDLAYIYRFSILFEYFYTWHQVNIQLYSLACEYPAFLAPFVLKTILSPLNSLASLSKII